MTIKYTPQILKKLEELLDEIGYVVRFEKGNFQSGYCIILERKVVVVNKFLPLEGRITALIDIIITLDFDTDKLSSESDHFYQNLKMASV